MNITITGANGRMGRALVRAVAEQEHATLVGAIVRQGHEAVGHDAGALAGVSPLGVAVTDDASAAFAKADVVIDFTLPDASAGYAALAAELGVSFITGTTGMNESQWQQLRAVAATTPVFWASNMSLGVNVLNRLVEQAARVLGEEFDIEIIEMHHKNKLDAPSGTALTLGEYAARGRGVQLDDVMQPARHGMTGKRPAGEIGFAVLRGGDVVGEHTVCFAGTGERLELTHKARNRDIFARGAVKAALWMREKPAGLYGMEEMLAASGL